MKFGERAALVALVYYYTGLRPSSWAILMHRRTRRPCIRRVVEVIRRRSAR